MCGRHNGIIQRNHPEQNPETEPRNRTQVRSSSSSSLALIASFTLSRRVVFQASCAVESNKVNFRKFRFIIKRRKKIRKNQSDS